jgi:hypothetical protein
MVKKKRSNRGRPRIIPPELSRRFMIRTTDDDLETWENHARSLGYGGAAPWIRKTLNDAIRAAKSG